MFWFFVTLPIFCWQLNMIFNCSCGMSNSTPLETLHNLTLLDLPLIVYRCFSQLRTVGEKNQE